MKIDDEFEIIKEFIDGRQGEFKKPSKNSKFSYGDNEHLLYLKKTFINSRNFKIKIAEPKTITDDALWEYIQLQKNLSKKKATELARYHKIAMSIETKLGSLLESFIYKFIKEYNWIWCSGNIIKDIDFIKKNSDKENKVSWIKLQVKNSDNSENAASSRVRTGTDIIKWYRRISKVKNKDNWKELANLVSHDVSLEKLLNETNYKKYLKTKN
tara:strand:+ start:4215 stop:4853 length:639 start_codon:yes stop_codon:yes gene_type:complete